MAALSRSGGAVCSVCSRLVSRRPDGDNVKDSKHPEERARGEHILDTGSSPPPDKAIVWIVPLNLSCCKTPSSSALS